LKTIPIERQLLAATTVAVDPTPAPQVARFGARKLAFNGERVA